LTMPKAQAPASVRDEPTTERRAEPVKLTVALPKTAVEDIERIADESGKTKTQVLREAIALKTFIERELEQPDTRLLIERGGTTREIVFT
jgi:hypothetical protein